MVAKQEAAKVATKTILKPIIKNPLTLDDIEAAGQLIVDQMPDYVGELLDELAKQAYLPKWQLIGGILFEAYNNGYMSAYTLDPAWKDGFKLEMSECNFCHQEFMPVRVGQLFCCNECGQGRTKLSEVKKEGKRMTTLLLSNLLLISLLALIILNLYLLTRVLKRAGRTQTSAKWASSEIENTLPL